jgi:5-methylcytosine-specific restriction endonuclease McrA
MSRRDRRSPEAQIYRAWYKSIRWTKGMRPSVLARDQGLCQPCYRTGRIQVASVVHHKTEHKGDPTLFWDAANCEAVCKPCHDGPIQSDERLGFSMDVDASGWPTDPRHPANRATCP